MSLGALQEPFAQGPIGYSLGWELDNEGRISRTLTFFAVAESCF